MGHDRVEILPLAELLITKGGEALGRQRKLRISHNELAFLRNSQLTQEGIETTELYYV